MHNWRGKPFIALLRFHVEIMIGNAKVQIIFEMTYYEIIKLCKESIDRLNSAGFRMDDCKYVELYEDYKQMHDAGEKMTYIVSVLHDRYNVCERKIYELIKLFGSHCIIDAV